MISAHHRRTKQVVAMLDDAVEVIKKRAGGDLSRDETGSDKGTPVPHQISEGDAISYTANY
jgi:hypothetical protein